MLTLFGASAATYPYAESYFTAYVCGTIFALTATGLNQFVICQGFAKVGMASVMLGGGPQHPLRPGVHLRVGPGGAGGLPSPR